MALIRTGAHYPALMNWFRDEDLMDWFNENYSNTDTTLPSVNVKETENEFEIELAAPGMKKEDFDINLENNTLTISSEHQEKREEGEGKYARREFSYQSFRRTFKVPENMVDGENIEARYRNGILHVKLPKQEKARAKPAKRIEIR